MNITESKVSSNIAATTSAFALKGGLYTLAALATWGGGSVALQMLGPDNSTYMTVNDVYGAPVSFTANGQTTAALPPGQYKWTIATATAVYAIAASVPI